jgi:flagellar FliJ protein
MKKFEFKLQPVLNYRGYLEKVAQQKTAKAQLDIKDCEERIIDLKQSHALSVERIDVVLSKGVSSSEFKLYHGYLDSIEKSIDDEKLRKIELQKILKEKLQELNKKSIDKKAMGLYRDKVKAEYIEEAIKAEQKEIDEISSLKTARKIINEAT